MHVLVLFIYLKCNNFPMSRYDSNLIWKQEEQQILKDQKNNFEGEDVMLTWQDYKTMSFTQCVSSSLHIFN